MDSTQYRNEDFFHYCQKSPVKPLFENEKVLTPWKLGDLCPSSHSHDDAAHCGSWSVLSARKLNWMSSALQTLPPSVWNIKREFLRNPIRQPQRLKLRRTPLSQHICHTPSEQSINSSCHCLSHLCNSVPYKQPATNISHNSKSLPCNQQHIQKSCSVHSAPSSWPRASFTPLYRPCAVLHVWPHLTSSSASLISLALTGTALNFPGSSPSDMQ